MIICGHYYYERVQRLPCVSVLSLIKLTSILLISLLFTFVRYHIYTRVSLSGEGVRRITSTALYSLFGHFRRIMSTHLYSLSGRLSTQPDNEYAAVFVTWRKPPDNEYLQCTYQSCLHRSKGLYIFKNFK
jgi:hypothetical protein